MLFGGLPLKISRTIRLLRKPFRFIKWKFLGQELKKREETVMLKKEVFSSVRYEYVWGTGLALLALAAFAMVFLMTPDTGEAWDTIEKVVYNAHDNLVTHAFIFFVAEILVPTIYCFICSLKEQGYL